MTEAELQASVRLTMKWVAVHLWESHSISSHCKQLELPFALTIILLCFFILTVGIEMSKTDRYIQAATRENTRQSYRSAIEHYEVSWGGFLPATADSKLYCRW